MKRHKKGVVVQEDNDDKDLEDEEDTDADGGRATMTMIFRQSNFIVKLQSRHTTAAAAVAVG